MQEQRPLVNRMLLLGNRYKAAIVGFKCKYCRIEELVGSNAFFTGVPGAGG